MKTKVIYDGRKYCGMGPACPVVELYDGEKHCCVGACPKVEHDTDQKMVRIYDPDKPEKGSFEMSVEEYNNLLKHAEPVK